MHADLSSPSTSVVVTGGASGIGRASAEALAAAGRAVAILDLKAAEAEEVAREMAEAYCVATIGLGVDLSDPAAIEPALQQDSAALAALGGLVHDACVCQEVTVDAVGDDIYR